MKKILSVLIAVVMILSTVAIAPLTAGALETYTYRDWEYQIHSMYDAKTNQTTEEIWITNYKGTSEKKVTIPNEIDGKPVTFLYNNKIFNNYQDPEDMHFANHEIMTDLTIPENLRYIEGWMLMNCTALKNIHISSQNKYFDFDGANGILYMYQGSKTYNDAIHGLTNQDPNEKGAVFCDFSKHIVTIPSRVTTIRAYAFYNHENLEHINFHAGLKLIDDYAFYNTGLTEVTIPYGVTEIGYSAFMYSAELRSVTFPSTIKKIESQAFLETNIFSYYLPSTIEEIGYQAFGYSGYSGRRQLGCCVPV